MTYRAFQMVLAVLLLGHCHSSAATYYVDANSLTPAPPYATWGTASTDIQSAVDLASAGDTVLVTDGFYNTGGRLTSDGTTSLIVVTNAVTLQSVHGLAATTIDGGGMNRCLYLGDGATLNGFTLTNGYTGGNGGGMMGATSNALMIDCAIRGCGAANGGGFFGGTLLNSVISFCSSSGTGRGGGGGSAVLTNCLLLDNVAYHGGGAADSRLVASEVVGNTAEYMGGGLENCTAVYCNISGNTVLGTATNNGYGYGGGAEGGTLVSCKVSRNLASSTSSLAAAGGGVSSLTATDCVIEGNEADGDGGGGFESILYNCLLENNQSDWGGGTWRCGVVGSLLAQNFGAIDAGADIESEMINCTIVNNVSLNGAAGGVDGSGLINCILYSNESGGYGLFNGVNASYSYCCTFPLPDSGAGNITNAPSLQFDGIHLTANSPCRAAGSFNNAEALDIDGLPWLNPPCMGCAEYSTNSLPSLALQADYTNVLAGSSLAFQAIVTGGQASGQLWNFGDNSPDASGPAVSHVWTAPGAYTVQVTAYFSNTPITQVESILVDVATNDLPIMVSQPTNETVVVGGEAELSVVADGASALNYQWLLNGVHIPGATNPVLQLFYIQTNQAGIYSVVVTDPSYAPPAEVVSSNAVVTVILPDCSAPAQGMTAWWRGNGDLTDTVEGNNGSGQNISFTTGKVGESMVFADGISSVSVSPSPTLSFGDSPGVSAEGWIEPDAYALAATNAPIIEWDAGGTALLGFSAGGTLQVALVDALGVPHGLQSGPGLLDTNHWQHVAFTCDAGSGDLAIYVNGNVVASNHIGALVLPTGGGVNIGWSAATTNYFGGLMDELSVYDRALLPKEIMAIFNAEYAGKCNGALAPSVIQQPSNLSVSPGASAEFSVIAAGTFPLYYQWFRNGNPINAATNPVLMVGDALCSQNGSSYSISITNAGGSVISSNAALTIIDTPPQFSGLSNQVFPYAPSSVSIPILVSEPGLPASNIVLSGSSSNTNLVSDSQIAFGWAATNWLMTLTLNANEPGVTTISVLATGPCGATNQASFDLLITNYPPQISSIASQHEPLNAPLGPLAFTVSDVETPANQLTVTAGSSYQSLVATNQIVLSGLGANRTVTLLPGGTNTGTVTITLTVTDSLGASASTSFSVTLDLFTQIVPGFPPLSDSAAAWGDYDNDGQLDLLVSGSTNGLASGAFTRIYHNDGGTFTNFISLTNLYLGAVAWADYDRDGRLDAVVSGLSSANVPVTQLYHNNGDGTFTVVNAGFAGAYNGTLAWGDYDNDGAPDLYLSGLIIVSSNGLTPVTTNLAKLYHNNGDGTFTDMNTRLPGPNNGTASWADFDNDGRQDLLLVGAYSNAPAIAAVYRNLGGGDFSNVFNSYSSGQGGTGAWGDYNNDGWLDFVIGGEGAGATIYRNNGNLTFTGAGSLYRQNSPSVAWGDYNNDGYLDLFVGGNTSTLYWNTKQGYFNSSVLSLPGVQFGAVAWGDYNQDGNLDLLLPGTNTTIYRNNCPHTNTPPTPPTNLAALPGPTNGVDFSWSASSDAQTPSSGLNYNLRVGSAPGGVDVVSPLSDPTNGLRRVVALGNVGPAAHAQLLDLPQGTYYWSVQAIDTAFAGSPFAPEGTFTITNARPTISAISNQLVAPLTATPPIAFAVGDAETAASNLVLTAWSSNPDVVSPTNIIFGGAGSNRTIQLTPSSSGVATITVSVSDAQGAFGSTYFFVNATSFSLLSSNFVPLQNSFVVWGDYNNDGRLDVLMAGNTNGNLQLSPVTQLYRNDGHGVLTPVASGLPGVAYGAAAWGDFNNDGYLDLVLTGTTNGQASGAIARIYRNNGDGTFADIGAGLPGVYQGAVAWGDFDNDGRLDLLLAGTTNGFAGGIARIYHNNGDGTFSNTVSLPGVFEGSVACADFDGDGNLDIVLTGMVQSGGGEEISWVYRNDGDGTFTKVAVLTNNCSGSVAVGDFDNDGRPDILLAGYSTGVYHNNGDFSFSNIGANLRVEFGAPVAWGDFDNDGRLDILLGGSNSLPFNTTAIYRNTGSSNLSQSFSLYPSVLPTNYYGMVTWADCENDGKLDLLLAGTDGSRSGNYFRSQTMLFRNNSGVANTPPTAPTALSATRSNGVAFLTWAKSTDAQTANSNGLSYQIRVGATPGGIEIVSPGADLATGYRRLVQAGYASTNQWRLANLPPGTYYWSVQAIDTAFAGSPFAAESTFTVLPSPVANPDTISTAINTAVTFSATNLTLNDFDPNGYPLTVIGVGPHSLMNGTVVLAGGMITYMPSNNFVGNDAFTYTVSDGQSNPVRGTVLALVGTGGLLSFNVISAPSITNGNFTVSLIGVAGLTYTLETSSSPTGPWAKVGNATASMTNQGFGAGAFQLVEPVAGYTMRFYRLKFPPD